MKKARFLFCVSVIFLSSKKDNKKWNILLQVAITMFEKRIFDFGYDKIN
jgi:hypothetical protein